MIFYHIDQIDMVGGSDGALTIVGWAFASERPPLRIRVLAGGKEIPCRLERFQRPDVMLVFKGMNHTENAGIQLVIAAPWCTNQALTVEFSEEGTPSQSFSVSEELARRESEKRTRLFSYLRTLNLQRCRKGMYYLWNFGPRFVWKRLQARARENGNLLPTLEQIARIIPSQHLLQQQRQQRFERMPKISLAVPLYNTPLNYLKEMLHSVLDQSYRNWELCLADGSDAQHAYVEDTVRQICGGDERVHYRRLEKNAGIAGNSNAALEMASGEYIGLLDHDDILSLNALFEMVRALNEPEAADMLYSDEASFSRAIDNAPAYHFKPDFSIDNLRSNNYICHFLVASRELYDAVGGFREGFDGSQDHDLILRMSEKAKKIRHIPQILYYWRNNPISASNMASSRRKCIISGVKAVQSHYDRLGIKATAEVIEPFTIYRTRYEIPGEPMVSILIPNKDGKEMLERCIRSILLRTNWRNFEIVVLENNSSDPALFRYYRELEQDPRIRVVTCEGQTNFNYSYLNNYGARFCRGEYLLFLNNDTEVISQGWLGEMLMMCARPDVGACGAMLYFPNDTVQHAGVMIGYHGTAGHHSLGFPRYSTGYFGRLLYQQTFSAVTFACCMVKRSVFDELGGLDETLAVAYNDVDFCLRVRQRGLLVAWTPFAELYHHESVSRGYDRERSDKVRLAREKQIFQTRWQALLESGDPYYNGNLTLIRPDFVLKQPEELQG